MEALGSLLSIAFGNASFDDDVLLSLSSSLSSSARQRQQQPEEEEWILDEVSFAAELQKLAGKHRNPSATTGSTDATKKKSSSKHQSPSPPSPPPLQQGSDNQPRLRVDRNEGWLRASAPRIESMLTTVLPPFALDPRPTVRQACVSVCGTLLRDCGHTLPTCQAPLSAIIYAAAQDEWPSVASTARSFLPAIESLQKNVQPRTNIYRKHAAGRLALEWLHSLPGALRQGSTVGTMHALKLLTCLETIPTIELVEVFFANPAEVDRIAATVGAVLAVGEEAAAAALVAPSLPDSNPHGGSTHATMVVKMNSSEEVNEGGEGVMPMPVLPRMPVGLKYISTLKMYISVAAVLRRVGCIAVHSQDALRGLVDVLLATLDDCLIEIEIGGGSGSGSGSDEEGDEDEEERKRKRMRRKRRRMRRGKGYGVKTRGEERMPGRSAVDDGEDKEEDEDDNAPPPIAVATQIVLALTEILYGACATTSYDNNNNNNNNVEDVVKAVFLLLMGVDEEESSIWSLPTSIPDPSISAPTSVSHPSSTPKQRGCNAFLQRAVLDCIGACALGLGRIHFSPFLLRIVVLPCVEKLADSCMLVSSAARTSLEALAYVSIAKNSLFSVLGSGSGNVVPASKEKEATQLMIGALVAENADYIVDGLCRQLRQPQLFPRAPHLFAALLREGGVAPGLVPLLAEPARQALQGISILARKKRPEHVFPFVLCLREIGRGAGVVAAATLEELKGMTASMQVRHDDLSAALLLLQREKGEKGGEGEEDDVDRMVNAFYTTTTDHRQEREIDVETIRKFFINHNHNRQRQQERQNEEELYEAVRVPVTMVEWNEIQILQKKASSCARLAQSTVDTAGPLCLSSSLPVAVQSLLASAQALQALAAASTAVDTVCTKTLLPLILPPGSGSAGASAAPTPTPTLLPSIHALWSPLMGALDDWRVAVVESALEVAIDLSKLAGTFISRRMKTEAWPRMVALLQRGPCQRKIIAPGQDDVVSPAVVQRTRVAVFKTLQSMCTSGAADKGALSLVTSEVLSVVKEYCGGEVLHPEVKEAATNAFMALAALDPDSAWVLLAEAGEMAAILKTDFLSFGGGGSGGGGGKSDILPPLGVIYTAKDRTIAAPTSMRSGSATKSVSLSSSKNGLWACGRAKLLALKAAVDAISPVPWHQEVLQKIPTA